MKEIIFKTERIFSSSSELLKEQLSENIKKFQNEKTYYNTEGSLVWIVRGCIDYFDKLDGNFLGEGNASGIPSSEADHFANNFYRLIKSMNYLGDLWGFVVDEPTEISLLKDIRTLIVHSGEQITKIESLELNEYKDSQLGRIIKKSSSRAFPFSEEYLSTDYCVTVWNDKHDKSKRHNMSEVDYHNKNRSFIDCSIYITASDIRNVVLCHIEDFLNRAEKVEIKKVIKKLPKIKNKIIDVENHEIDFDKLAELISKSTRGGYIIEQDLVHWDGFGLKRLYLYAKNILNIDNKARNFILKRIEDTMSDFWNDYQNVNYSDDELTDLDIRELFRDFTPNYDRKHYLEGEKLFYKIAPFFNIKGKGDVTDIDYLCMFISKVNNALNIELNLEQSVDGIICEYFVRSVESSISR